MDSRELILGRIRKAIADAPPAAAIERRYLGQHGERDTRQLADLLAENLSDYRAVVHRTDAADLSAAIARLLAERGARRVLVPPGIPQEYLAGADVAVHIDGDADAAHELDQFDSAVTGCAIAVAETGTIILDGSPDQGRRRITLMPDHHICIVRVPGQVVASVPQALTRVVPGRPLTWISGPSATSDIELDRVEGVHGPRRLDVILAM